MSKARLATVWLDGCSGCHMSFLDMDERLLELTKEVDLVFSPLVDTKEFPEQVDVTLVEGAVSSEDDLERIRRIRQRTRILVALGDCAVTGNVPSMRNIFPVSEVLDCAYRQNATLKQQIPSEVVPKLLERVIPVHEAVKVDVHIPGCPPSADVIYSSLCELLRGNTPTMDGKTRFGA